MRIQLLDNITGKWAMQWIVTWFICGVIALSAGFWLTTEHTTLDMFYLGVSFVGLVCVVSLSFRKNVMGNGLGNGSDCGRSRRAGDVWCSRFDARATLSTFSPMSTVFFIGQNIPILMAT